MGVKRSNLTPEPEMETANVNGRKVLCVVAANSIVKRLDAITFRDPLSASLKREELKRQGVVCEVVKMGRVLYLAV